MTPIPRFGPSGPSQSAISIPDPYPTAKGRGLVTIPVKKILLAGADLDGAANLLAYLWTQAILRPVW